MLILSGVYESSKEKLFGYLYLNIELSKRIFNLDVGVIEDTEGAHFFLEVKCPDKEEDYYLLDIDALLDFSEQLKLRFPQIKKASIKGPLNGFKAHKEPPEIKDMPEDKIEP